MKLRFGHKSQILKFNQGFKSQAGFQALLQRVLLYSKSGYSCLGLHAYQYLDHDMEGF